MPRYKFIHEFETVFNHLRHGEGGNATVHPGDDRDVPDSTVALRPGDEISTVEPEDHPYLEPATTPAPPTKTASVKPVLAATQE